MVEVTYSTYDGGWYAEVYLAESGRTVYTTPVYPTKQQALDEARRWLGRRVGTDNSTLTDPHPAAPAARHERSER